MQKWGKLGGRPKRNGQELQTPIRSRDGKRGSFGVYWYKLMWQGKPVRESSTQGNDGVAGRWRLHTAHGCFGSQTCAKLIAITGPLVYGINANIYVIAQSWEFAEKGL